LYRFSLEKLSALVAVDVVQSPSFCGVFENVCKGYQFAGSGFFDHDFKPYALRALQAFAFLAHVIGKVGPKAASVMGPGYKRLHR
jgi:hypothetical protein